MKTIFRTLLTGALLLVASTSFGQGRFAVGVNGIFAVPVSGEFDGSNQKLSDAVKSGFGGGLSLRYLPTEQLRVSLNTGVFDHQFDADDDASLRFIPVTASVDYAFGDGIFRPYVGAEAGVFFTRGIDLRNPLTGNRRDTDAEGFFGFGPTVGGLLAINDNLSAELAVKYQFIFISDSDTFRDITAGVLPISLGLNWTF